MRVVCTSNLFELAVARFCYLWSIFKLNNKYRCCFEVVARWSMNSDLSLTLVLIGHLALIPVTLGVYVDKLGSDLSIVSRLSRKKILEPLYIRTISNKRSIYILCFDVECIVMRVACLKVFKLCFLPACQ